MIVGAIMCSGRVVDITRYTRISSSSSNGHIWALKDNSPDTAWIQAGGQNYAAIQLSWDRDYTIAKVILTTPPDSGDYAFKTLEVSICPEVTGDYFDRTTMRHEPWFKACEVIFTKRDNQCTPSRETVIDFGSEFNGWNQGPMTLVFRDRCGGAGVGIARVQVFRHDSYGRSVGDAAPVMQVQVASAAHAVGVAVAAAGVVALVAAVVAVTAKKKRGMQDDSAVAGFSAVA